MEFPSNFSTSNVNDIIEFLAEYYSRFLVEDSLYPKLRGIFIEAGKKAGGSGPLRGVFYAESNEPVRLGAFRVLFNEVHRRVHGHLSPRNFDLALHGVMKENLEVSSNIGLGITEQYHVGIDYVSLIEYPAPSKNMKVTVPLFIIAKSRPDDVKEVKIMEAVEAVTKALPRGQNEEFKKVIHALESIPKFTRIILTKTASNVNEPCITKEHQGIPVYSDIACGIIGLVLMDLPKMYNEVVGDSELSKLTIPDWICTLISLAIPIIQIDVVSASSPPQPPKGGGGINIEDIVRRIRQESQKSFHRLIRGLPIHGFTKGSR